MKLQRDTKMKYQVKADLSRKNGAFSHFNTGQKGIESWCMNFTELTASISVLSFRTKKEMNFFMREYRKEFPELLLQKS